MIPEPSMRAAGRSGELDWLLDDLVARVSEVRHAVVLSNDGLAVGSSSGLRRSDAEHRLDRRRSGRRDLDRR